jgi:hypothetical protein
MLLRKALVAWLWRSDSSPVSSLIAFNYTTTTPLDSCEPINSQKDVIKSEIVQ